MRKKGIRRSRQLESRKRVEGEMEIEPYPEIMEYIVILTSGRKIRYSIASIYWLESHLHLHGLQDIQRIIFRFFNPRYHSYYYPYSVHNIVLEKTSNFIIPHFYHYYNVKNERIDIPPQQQFYDYCAIEQFLFQHPILYYTLYVNLMRPPFVSYQPLSYQPSSLPFFPTEMSREEGIRGKEHEIIKSREEIS